MRQSSLPLRSNYRLLQVSDLTEGTCQKCTLKLLRQKGGNEFQPGVALSHSSWSGLQSCGSVQQAYKSVPSSFVIDIHLLTQLVEWLPLLGLSTEQGHLRQALLYDISRLH